MKAMNSEVDFVGDLDLMWMLFHQYPLSTSTTLSDFGVTIRNGIMVLTLWMIQGRLHLYRYLTCTLDHPCDQEINIPNVIKRETFQY